MVRELLLALDRIDAADSGVRCVLMDRRRTGLLRGGGSCGRARSGADNTGRHGRRL